MAEKPKPPVVINQATRIVRKSTREIGYRIKSGKLTLVSRKIFNVLLYYAQSMRDKEDADGRWSIPVSSLLSDTQVSSHNYDFLRACFDELQTTQVVRDSDTGGMTSEALIPSFTIDNVVHSDNEASGTGNRKRGGALWAWFSLPPKLKQQLLNPDEYARLPLEYLAALRTVAGLALYEICRRYITNPSKVTYRDTWQNWYLILSGEPLGSDIPDYKYVNRNIFKKAVLEVNSLTDIDVEILEFKAGRFVKEIQFSVSAKAQSDLGFEPAPVNPGLLSRLAALGVSLVDAERLIAKYDEKDLIGAMSLVEDRASNKALPVLGSPAAYLKKALRDGYAAGQQLEREIKEKDKGEKIEKAAAAAKKVEILQAKKDIDAAKKIKSNLEKFDGFDKGEQDRLIALFRSENPALSRSKISSTLFKNAFGSWLSRAAQ